MKKKLDFSNVETFQRAPEGTHVVKIQSVEEATFQSGNDGFKVVFEIKSGAGKGARVYENFPLAENSLWKLKTLLEAIGIKCDGRIMLDTDKMIGKTLEIDVYHEEYEGKMRARLGEMRKLVKSKVENDDEDEDIDEEDIDEEVEEKSKKAASKKSPAKKSKNQPEPEEDDDDEEEDVEEEKPAKKSKKEPAKKSKKKEPEPEEDDDWDDDDDDWEDA